MSAPTNNSSDALNFSPFRPTDLPFSCGPRQGPFPLECLYENDEPLPVRLQTFDHVRVDGRKRLVVRGLRKAVGADVLERVHHDRQPAVRGSVFWCVGVDPNPATQAERPHG